MNTVSFFSVLFAAFCCKCLMRVEAGGFYKMNVRQGRSNISKHQHFRDWFYPHPIKNTICSHVEYPSLVVMPSIINETTLSRYPLHMEGGAFQNYSNFFQFASVNNLGSLNFNKASRPPHVYVVPRSLTVDREMYLCVYHEPRKSGEMMSNFLYPFVHVDWISIDSGFLHSSMGKLLKFTTEISKTYESTCHMESVEMETLGAVIASPTVTMLNEHARSSLEISTWVDSIMEADDFKRIRVCLAVVAEHNMNEMTVHTNILIAYDSTDSRYPHSSVIPSRMLTGHLQWTDAIKPKAVDPICFDKAFDVVYDVTPHIFVTASYRNSPLSGNSPAVTAWVEFINEIGFRACVAPPIRLSDDSNNVWNQTASIEYIVIRHDGLDTIPIVGREIGKSTIMKVTMSFNENYQMERFEEIFATFDKPIARYMLRALDDESSEGEALDISHFTQTGYIFNHEIKQLDVFYNIDTGGQRRPAMVDMIAALSKAQEDSPYIIFRITNDNSLNAFVRSLFIDKETLSRGRVYYTAEFYDGCIPLGYFKLGKCSVPECDAVEYKDGGTLTLQRGFLGDSVFCPSHEKEVQCNLPPCQITNSIHSLKYTDSGHSHLPMILGIGGALIAALLVGGGIWLYIKKYKFARRGSRLFTDRLVMSGR